MNNRVQEGGNPNYTNLFFAQNECHFMQGKKRSYT